MTKTKQEIVKQLETNVKVLKLAYSDLLCTRLQEGKTKYGSVAEFRKVKENVRVQIETLNTFLEWCNTHKNKQSYQYSK